MADLQPGERLDQFDVTGVLARSGMATLYRARDTVLGRPYGRYPLGAPSTAGVSLGYGKAVVGIGTGKGTGGGVALFK